MSSELLQCGMKKTPHGGCLKNPKSKAFKGRFSAAVALGEGGTTFTLSSICISAHVCLLSLAANMLITG